MAKSESVYKRARRRLGRLTPVHLVGVLAMSNAAFYEETSPEKWQAKGKRPKPKVR